MKQNYFNVFNVCKNWKQRNRFSLFSILIEIDNREIIIAVFNFGKNWKQRNLFIYISVKNENRENYFPVFNIYRNWKQRNHFSLKLSNLKKIFFWAFKISVFQIFSPKISGTMVPWWHVSAIGDGRKSKTPPKSLERENKFSKISVFKNVK